MATPAKRRARGPAGEQSSSEGSHSSSEGSHSSSGGSDGSDSDEEPIEEVSGTGPHGPSWMGLSGDVLDGFVPPR